MSRFNRKMRLKEYQKAECAFVATALETCLLVASKPVELEVKAAAQELAPEVDFEDDPFKLKWE